MNPTPFTIRLDEPDRRALRKHFLALAGEDRRLRFGFIASDAVIERYATTSISAATPCLA